MKRNKLESLTTVTIVIDQNVRETLVPNKRGDLSRVLAVQNGSNGVMQRVPHLVFNNWRNEMEQTKSRFAHSGTAVRLLMEDKQTHKVRRIDAFGSDLEQIVLRERVRLILLLNTLGGCMEAKRKLSDYMDRVKSNGGEVWALGRNVVHSAGAFLFMEADADKRILEETASILFHLTTHARLHRSHSRSLAEIERQRIEEIADLKRYLASSTFHGDHYTYLEDLLDRRHKQVPIGKDIKCDFSSAEAQLFWHVKREDTETMWNTYQELVGGKVSAHAALAAPQAQPIRRFFSQ